MFDEILERIVARFRCFQLQMRLGNRAERRDQDRAGGAFRPAEDSLVKFERAFVMIELRLEPALEITLLFLIAERGRPRFVEDPARAGHVVLFEEQLDRAQLGAIVPLHVAQEQRICPKRFIGTLQSPQRLGLPKQRRGSERRRILGRDFLVKGERFRPALQTGQSLGAPKRNGRQIVQGRVL